MSMSESYQLESFGSEVGKPIELEYARTIALRQRARGWELAKIIIRSIGTLSSFIVIVVNLIWYSDEELFNQGSLIWAAAPAAFIGSLWDLAEYMTICARRGRGITPKAHIGVELMLFLGTAAGLGIVAWQQTRTFYFGETMNLSIAVTVTVAISTVVRLFLFIRACAERSQEIKRRRPRIMYTPETGQAFYVAAKPSSALPPKLTAPSQRRLQHTQASTTSSQALRLPPLSIPTSGSAAPTLIPRRPVPHRNAVDDDNPPRPPPKESNYRPSPRAPPPDYVPDEAELERRRRGDAQPQLILPEHMDLKFSASVTGMTPVDSNGQEGKFLIETPVSGGPSQAQSRTAR